MMNATVPAVPLAELLQHLEQQRHSAYLLIEEQNRILTGMLGRGAVPFAPRAETITAVQPVVREQARTRGNVVSLFDYAKKEQPATASRPVTTTGAYLVFDENDTEAARLHGAEIAALLSRYGADDAMAINRKQMAGTIFMADGKDALFYVKNASGILFVVCYAGPDERYATALRELKAYAAEQGLMINLMAHESRVADLKANGFTTTPMGIWQRIDPISSFTLDGSAMRRLRYLVNKYQKSGNCRTEEYKPGTDSGKDAAICQVMDQWVALKGQKPPFVELVKNQMAAGSISDDHRFFLTWRDETLDNVIVFSRDNMNDGYLMDLEFYSGDMPLGSTEFALSEIIAVFNAEGRRVVSLGLTMGTGLFEHENGSNDVFTLFESLRKAEYLNGDANAQYKNKYRPQTTTMYLARPRDSGKKKLNDLLMLLGTG